MNEIILRLVARPSTTAEQILGSIEDYWRSVRDEVVSAAGERLAIGIDQIVADARRVTERPTNTDPSSRLFGSAFMLAFATYVLQAEELQSLDARSRAAQRITAIASALLDLRGSLSGGGQKNG